MLVIKEEFTKQAQLYSYEPRHQTDKSNDLFFVRTKNNVKTEIDNRKECYTVGYGIKNSDDLQLLLDELQSKGFEYRPSASAQVHRFKLKPDVLQGFWELVKTIEDIEGIIARRRTLGRQLKITRDESIFIKIARRYKYAIEHEDQGLLDLARQLLEADSIDDKITRGHSKNWQPHLSYREHVVPCIMIHNQAFDMALVNYSAEDIAAMIERHLAIVLITPDEAYKLDCELGLRTEMPQGWQFGDDVYARLTTAGIEYRLN